MSAPAIIDAAPLVQKGLGGGLEGAERLSRETALWTPPFISADRAINLAKPLADARGRDMVQNDGYINGVVNMNRDSIVGSSYRLNAQPNWRAMNLKTADEMWAEEYQLAVESRFTLVAESLANWLDASRKTTFTGLIRQAVAGYCFTGEVLATAEWIREPSRPCYTAIQLISPDRLSNPNGLADSMYLRRGVEIDRNGKPLNYNIRKSYPTDIYPDADLFTWATVPATKPWGRVQVIHIFESMLPGQNRGIADMVAALKQMKMTKNFQEITLQKAVVAASYVAAIESELPPNEVFAMMGQNQPTYAQMIEQMMGLAGAYVANAKNVSVDGAKIPLLPPGTKINAKPLGEESVDIRYEQSLLRHIAAALGVSYEEFSRDFSQTNYSSARASMAQTWKFMQGRKKMVADRLATHVYALWLEEEIADGNIPLPAGVNREHFYMPLMKEAYTQCSWIGAARGQIDELKETTAAALRIKSGLSTREEEISRFGKDWREVFDQLAREKRMADQLGLEFDLAVKDNGSTQDPSQDGGNGGNQNQDNNA